MQTSCILIITITTFFVGSAACSSDDPSTTASPCAEAKKVSDDCKVESADSGISFKFDEAKCESGGDQAKAAATCIVNNKSNCNCLLKCSLSGSC